MAQATPGDHKPLICGGRWQSMGELCLDQSFIWSFCGWNYRQGTLLPDWMLTFSLTFSVILPGLDDNIDVIVGLVSVFHSMIIFSFLENVTQSKYKLHVALVYYCCGVWGLACFISGLSRNHKTHCSVSCFSQRFLIFSVKCDTMISGKQRIMIL
jgi:hypothetical protein